MTERMFERLNKPISDAIFETYELRKKSVEIDLAFRVTDTSSDTTI